ncbi:hypothetical protein [Desulfuromusa kysingii]|nr:hypothetical protein [Desulfuromusa kysingii]
MKMIVMGLSSILVFGCLSGCGSDNHGEEDAAVDPSGIWIGYQTSIEKDIDGNTVSNAFDMRTIIYDGAFYGISEDANIIYSGTYEMGSNGRMVSDGSEGGSHSYKMYTISDDGAHWTDGVAIIDFAEAESFVGIYQNSAYQEGELVSDYSSLYNKGASLDYVDGDHTESNVNIIIDSIGTISGTKNGCQISGVISVPNEEVNVYSLNYTLSNCTEEGSYTGLGIVATNSDDSSKTHFLGLTKHANESRMDGLGFSLESTPASFKIARLERTVRGWLGIENKDSFMAASLAYLKNIRLPEVIGSAHAASVFGGLDAVVRFVLQYDLSDQNLRGVNFDSEEFESRGIYPEYNSSNGDKWYHHIDFSHSEMVWSDIYVNLGVSTFEGADLSHAYLQNPDHCIFINTNLEDNRNIEDISASSVFENDFSNAWWVDGHRCGIDVSIISIGSNQCEDNWIDTGLTYEEWKSGKWEAEKVAENLVEELKDTAEEAENFIKDTGGTVKSFFGF